MNHKIVILIFSILFILSGCNVTRDLTGAYNMTQCEYKYKSVSNLEVAGMNLSKGISPLYIPKITSILNGHASSIPLNFTLNLNVNNPNASVALLHGVQYTLSVDEIEFTSGTVNQPLDIPANSSQILPVDIAVDLATLIEKNSKGAIENIAKNFLGLGSGQSKVNIMLKPTFMIGGRPITSPVYFPVDFSFGGK